MDFGVGQVFGVLALPLKSLSDTGQTTQLVQIKHTRMCGARHSALWL